MKIVNITGGLRNQMFQLALKVRYAKEKILIKNAISLIIEKSRPECFVIFSDDVNWCRTFITPMLGQYKLFFADWNKRETSFRDMELMSYCRNNIIANSTFSWWGAW